MQFFFKAGINNLITSRVMHLSISTPPPVPPPSKQYWGCFRKFENLWQIPCPVGETCTQGPCQSHALQLMHYSMSTPALIPPPTPRAIAGTWFSKFWKPLPNLLVCGGKFWWNPLPIPCPGANFEIPVCAKGGGVSREARKFFWPSLAYRLQYHANLPAPSPRIVAWMSTIYRWSLA